MNTIGEMIKALLKMNNLKQKDLAEKLGVQSSAVSQWVTGKTQVDPKNLPGLAKYLGVTIDDLLSGKMPETLIGVSKQELSLQGNVSSVRPGISELYTYIPFLSAKAQAGIPGISYENCSLSWVEESYPVILPQELVRKQLLVIEVIGDSMEPEIRSGAKVLAFHVQANDIRYESGGVYAILYANRFVVKRIKTNTLTISETLILHSDNDRFGEIVVEGSEIQCVWKVVGKVWESVQ